jgi:nicotinate-nucleotide adenylyltransferase
MTGFGAGVLVLLVATVPGATPHPPAALAWVLAASAFLAPLPPLPQPQRILLLAFAAVFTVGGLVAVRGILPRPLAWVLLAGAFHLAAQAFASRPRRVPAPPLGPRVAVFGGSFDPFHRGHRALCEAALKVVDRLLVVPAGQAPHKQAGPEPTAFHHRVALCRLGVEGLARTEVLELEGRRPGPSYTVDTLDVLRSTFPPGTRFLLVLGADMYQDFPTWREWERVLEGTVLLVAQRPGYDLEAPPELEGRNVVVERLEAGAHDVSGTGLRADIAAGRAVGDRISPAVQAYVREHGLYAPVRAR